MTARLDLLIAFGLALMFHLAVFGWRAPEEGVQSAGDGGDAQVSIEASSASVAAMVTEWETPPDVVLEVPVAQPVPPDLTAPTTPTPPEAQPLERAQPPALTATPSVTAPPDVVSQPAPQIPQPDVATPPDFMALSLPTAPVSPGLAALPPADELERPDTPAAPALAPPPPPTSLQLDTASAPIPLLDGAGNVQRSPRPQAKPQTEEALEAAQAAEAKSQAARAPPPPPQQPATQSSAASRASNEQRSLGAGGNQNAGSSQQSQASTISSSQRASLMRSWGAQIRSRVARNQRSQRRSGRVVVRISVSNSGQLAGVGVLSSSGNSALDNAAVATVRRARRFPAAPSGLGSGPHTFDIPLTFE